MNKQHFEQIVNNLTHFQTYIIQEDSNCYLNTKAACAVRIIFKGDGFTVTRHTTCAIDRDGEQHVAMCLNDTFGYEIEKDDDWSFDSEDWMHGVCANILDDKCDFEGAFKFME